MRYVHYIYDSHMKLTHLIPTGTRNNTIYSYILWQGGGMFICVGAAGLKKDRLAANLSIGHTAVPIDTSALLPCLRLGAGFC